MTQTYGPTLFAKAATDVGMHPFPCPSANMSRAYRNPLGVGLAPCTYCGFCEKFACGNYSKASAQTTILPVLMRKSNFTLKIQCEVTRINLDNTGKRATSVTYVDAQGEEYEQPAELVILGAYILHNVHLLLTSKIGTPYDPSTGKGTLGKNYAYQITPSVDVFFDDKILNPFVGAGALGMMVDDFNGDSFDHTGLGFLHGGYIGGYMTTGRPIETELLPAGTPKWGKKWKQAFVKNYLTSMSMGLMGSVMPNRTNYLDLDPTYRDVYGKPLMRMTFDFKQNELKMQDFEMQKMVQIAKAMQPREIRQNKRGPHYDIAPYQSTHNTGGAIMGASPNDSVVNRYLQHWQVPNLIRRRSQRISPQQRLQSDRHAVRIDLLGARSNPQPIPKIARPAGAGMSGIATARGVGATLACAAIAVFFMSPRPHAEQGSFTQNPARQIPCGGRRLPRLPHCGGRRDAGRRSSAEDAIWNDLCAEYYVGRRNRNRVMDRRPILSGHARGHRSRRQPSLPGFPLSMVH